MEQLEYGKRYFYEDFIQKYFVYLGFNGKVHVGIHIPVDPRSFSDHKKYLLNVITFEFWENMGGKELILFDVGKIQINHPEEKKLLEKIVKRVGSFTNPNFPHP